MTEERHGGMGCRGCRWHSWLHSWHFLREPETSSSLAVAGASPRVQRARASTISSTARRLASGRNGQVSQAGADKTTITVTGSTRIKGVIAESGGSALTICLVP